MDRRFDANPRAADPFKGVIPYQGHVARTDVPLPWGDRLGCKAGPVFFLEGTAMTPDERKRFAGWRIRSRPDKRPAIWELPDCGTNEIIAVMTEKEVMATLPKLEKLLKTGQKMGKK